MPSSRDTADDYVELVAERLAPPAASPRATMRLGDVWAGIYPMRPDGRPVVGPHDGRASVGHRSPGAGGSGLQSSPALGAHRRGLDPAMGTRGRSRRRPCSGRRPAIEPTG